MREIAESVEGYIVTGHHTDDYLESVLIHLIRGGGPACLETLKLYQDNLFRPLLVFTQDERGTILHAENPVLFEDESNQDMTYLRNRIRREILPVLAREGLDSWKLYHNFHDITMPGQGKKENISFVRLASDMLKGLALHDTKKLLDVVFSRLGLHPVKKGFLLEFFRQLNSGNIVALENEEAGLYKTISGDLYAMPLSSPCFIPPKIKLINAYTSVQWNSREISLPGNFQMAGNAKTIRHRGITKEISEIMRQLHIPPKIRPNIPILLEGGETKYILFSMWDKDLENLKSDNA